MDAAIVDRLRFSLRGGREEAVGAVRFIEAAGARLRVWDSGGAGTAVVVAPDPPNVIEHHVPHLERLGERVRTVCVELPGFGFSRPAPGYDFSLAQTAETVLAALEALGIERAVLAFSCVAGLAAIEASARRPDRVAGLVLSQTPSLADAQAWARRVDFRGLIGTPVVGQLLVRAARRPLARAWYDAALPRRWDRRPFLRKALKAYDAGADYCLASALQALKRLQPEELAPVDVPALVLWGRADRTHRRSDPERLRGRLPRLAVEALPGVGHFPDLEWPEAWLGAIQRFMDQHGG